MQLKREIHFKPAWDKRSEDPKKNYGVHGVEITFTLQGDKKGVTFTIYTHWHLPHVQKEVDAHIDSRFPHLSCHPMGANVSYHSPTPLYKGQECFQHECPITSGDCYYDGSGLMAQDLLSVLIEDGEEAVWTALEAFAEDRLRSEYEKH